MIFVWGPVQVKVLKSLRRPTLDEVALGQYKARTNKAGDILDPGYLDEPGVPADSLAPTFAAMAFYIDNARWALICTSLRRRFCTVRETQVIRKL